MLNQDTKKILSLAVPAALSNFLDIVQVLVDMIMLGRVSPSAIASAGISMQFLGLLYAMMATFSVGTSVVISRYIGAKQYSQANKTAFSISVFSLLLSIPFTILGFFFSKYIFMFMASSDEVIRLGQEYFSILALTFPVLFMEMAIYSAFNAAGDTKTPLKIVIVANIINTVLAYGLIFGNFGFPRLEVKGAAIATAISYYISFFMYLYVINSKHSKIRFEFEFILEEVKKILKIGIPSGFERTLTYFSFLLFVKIIADYGIYTLAGYQVGLRIEGLAFMPGFGFTIAAMTLVGQSLGSNNPQQAEVYAKEIIKIASIFMGLMGVVMVIFPEYLAMVFTNDKKTIEEASLYLRIVGLTQIPLAIGFVLSGVLRGAGATKTTLYINTFSLWVLRIIPAYILSKIFGNILFVYLAMFLETYLKAAILWYFFKKGDWKKIKV
jgi:putative MATE family efflux protein